MCPMTHFDISSDHLGLEHLVLTVQSFLHLDIRKQRNLDKCDIRGPGTPVDTEKKTQVFKSTVFQPHTTPACLRKPPGSF